MVDTEMAAAFTGMTCPSNNFPIKGVNRMAPMVVIVVMRTESAKSPCPIYVHKLLACAPLIHATKIKPAARDGDNDKARPIIQASVGICIIVRIA